MIFQALLSSLLFSGFIRALNGLNFNNFPGRSFFNLKKIISDARVAESRRNILYPPWRPAKFEAGGPSPSSQDVYPRNIDHGQFDTVWDYNDSTRKASPSSKSAWSNSNTQGWGSSPFEGGYSVEKLIRTTGQEKTRTVLINPTTKIATNPTLIDDNTNPEIPNSQITSNSIYNQTPSSNATEKHLLTPRHSKRTEKLVNSLFEYPTNDITTRSTTSTTTITTIKSVEETPPSTPAVPAQPVKRRVQYKYSPVTPKPDPAISKHQPLTSAQYKYSPVTPQPEPANPKHQPLAAAQYKYSPVTPQPEPAISKPQPLAAALPAVPTAPHLLPLSPSPPHAAPLSYPAISYSHLGQDCRVEDSVVQAEVCTPTLDTQCSPISLRGTKVTSIKSLTLSSTLLRSSSKRSVFLSPGLSVHWEQVITTNTGEIVFNILYPKIAIFTM